MSLPLILFYHCPSSSFPPLSFLFFPLTQSLSESLTPISLQLKPLHSQSILFFLSSCLSVCTCVCVCVRAHVALHISTYLSLSLSLSLSISLYLFLSFSSFDSAFAAQHPPTHNPPPPPQLLGRDPAFNIIAERSIISQNLLLSAEMLNMLNMFKSLSQKMLLSGEILNM